ncbi:chaperone protein dnaJ 20, chloroplastic-like [Juglans regia]|uniref:Chaperone protein dnaJ 20, chloroplastic-like n=2 Tax=Juglans regia TaxID=51240 RepID=A0A2I4GDL4_JUGRE|nr:chaperone protein dnaJ 20, chloroplastic-like [Juglans regia]
MAVLLSSSHSIGAKPFLSLPVLPSKRQRPRVQFVAHISCRASSSTKVAGENHVDTAANFYEVLSLSPNNASINEIKKAYRSMALRYHPDVCPPPMKEESTRMFVKLNAAYRTLLDPVLRKEYDCELLDLGSFGRTFKNMGINDDDLHGTRSRWQEQILELRRRSNFRMAGKEVDSWGSRIRAQNNNNI